MAEIDIKTEQELLRLTQTSDQRPRVLDIQAIKSYKTRVSDITKYRLEDLLKTILFKAKGLEYVRNIDHKKQTSGIKNVGRARQTNSPISLFNVWRFSIRTNEASVSLTPVLMRASMSAC